MQLGQHPEPSHVIAHLSDPHLLADSKPLHGIVDTEARLAAALGQLERSSIQPDALVFTGDLTDRGEADAYRRLRDLAEPTAQRLGAELVWVMGNHDERGPYAELLFDDPADGVRAQDRVYDAQGLRIIALDSTVPGYHHGALEPAQLDWLRDLLAAPAPHGTLIAMHHPPAPAPLTPAMAVLELEDQAAFADVICGTDVRAILAGHLHHSLHSSVAGVPVSVASASCYTLALGRPERLLGGVDAFQAFNAVHLYPDRVVHTVVPFGEPELISGIPSGDVLERIAGMSPRLRRELLSSKAPIADMATVLGPDRDAAARAITVAEEHLAQSE